jgi:hypothetical protein
MDAPLLLFLWARFGNPEACRDYVSMTLGADPSNALSLIRTFVPTSFSMGREPVLRSKSPGCVITSRALAQVADPERVAHALRITLPGLQAPEVFPSTFDGFTDDPSRSSSSISTSIQRTAHRRTLLGGRLS